MVRQFAVASILLITSLPLGAASVRQASLSADVDERTCVARKPATVFHTSDRQIFLALTASVSPEEIAHILLLVGTYSGIENFAGAIQNEAKTLHVLGRVVDAGSATPKDVFQALVKAFPS